MPKKMIDYECYRCGYATDKKWNMKKHLYDLKLACQAKEHDVLLTDEIKDLILLNRRYAPILNEVEKCNGNVVVLNNLVTRSDLIDKLNYILEYTQTQQIDFEYLVENCFSKSIKRLEDRSFKMPYLLDEPSLLDCFNRATQIENDVSQFSIYYDKNTDKICIYRSKKWKSFIKDIGLSELVSLVKSYYFNDYEIYLIRNIDDHSSLVKDRFGLAEHLDIYYKFIAIFDLLPDILNHTDHDILNFSPREDNPNSLSDKYIKMYEEQKKSLKSSEINNTRSKILNIIKGNTFQNINELNKSILDILKINDEFRNDFRSAFETIKH